MMIKQIVVSFAVAGMIFGATEASAQVQTGKVGAGSVAGSAPTAKPLAARKPASSPVPASDAILQNGGSGDGVSDGASAAGVSAAAKEPAPASNVVRGAVVQDDHNTLMPPKASPPHDAGAVPATPATK
jgi:hypothetical protein